MKKLDLDNFGKVVKLYEGRNHLRQKRHDFLRAMSRRDSVTINTVGARVDLDGRNAEKVLKFALSVITNELLSVEKELDKYTLYYEE